MPDSLNYSEVTSCSISIIKASAWASCSSSLKNQGHRCQRKLKCSSNLTTSVSQIQLPHHALDEAALTEHHQLSKAIKYKQLSLQIQKVHTAEASHRYVCSEVVQALQKRDQSQFLQILKFLCHTFFIRNQKPFLPRKDIGIVHMEHNSKQLHLLAT